ncbi:MAG: hypothetical protein DMG03_25090 [Acidobacteria bacterium]|nr:MAG: hypothetical protein DMG03_25090 [Acidobacteriota bacterium]
MNEDKATRYNRLKRRVTVVSLIATVGLLVALLATGWSLALRDAARSNVLAYVALFSIVNEAVGLPLAFYGGFLLERRYGLSNETFARWLLDQAKSFGIGLALGGGAAWLIYSCIRFSPERWWAIAGVLFALVIVAIGKRCAAGCSRWRTGLVHGRSVRTNGDSPTKPRKRTPLWPA